MRLRISVSLLATSMGGDEIWMGHSDFSWGPTGLVR